jgi:hypothetical protein
MIHADFHVNIGMRRFSASDYYTVAEQGVRFIMAGKGMSVALIPLGYYSNGTLFLGGNDHSDCQRFRSSTSIRIAYRVCPCFMTYVQRYTPV